MLTVFGLSLAQGISILVNFQEEKAMTSTIMWKPAGIAAGVGVIAGVLLAFRWRQRRGLGEKNKRL